MHSETIKFVCDMFNYRPAFCDSVGCMSGVQGEFVCQG